MKFKLSKRNKWILGVVVFLLVVWSIPQPSHDRNWKPDHAILPSARISGNILSIQNIRDFHYRSETDFDANYTNDTFDFSLLEKVWFGLSHFSEFEGAAHTFLSFEFSDGKILSISIEARQEVGESYSPFWGALKSYEIIYVVGTESDILKLRTNFRDERVYFYPAKITKINAQMLLKSYVDRIQKIEEKPEFYNTLANNCTNQIVAHIESFSDRKLPFTFTTILPGYSDEYAYQLDLIPTDDLLEHVRERYRIDKKISAEGEDFSKTIREAFTSK